MRRSDFNKLVKKKVVLLDGATGTELQKKGMSAGMSPEQWVLKNPGVLLDLQAGYVAAGSDIIYSCTFGCNSFKLADYGMAPDTAKINRRLALLSRKAAGTKCLVAGDIGSTGKLLRPFGDTEFEDVVRSFKEQVKGLLAGRVDLFVIETMIDIQEARAALLAVKESSDLPVIVSMTCEKNGRTLTGTEPVSALVTLQSLGADAVGVNCSTGPEDMLLILSAMRPYAKVPLLSKPNAGLPELVDGKTVFRMNAEEFASFAPRLVKAGSALVGGCCGTTAEHIRLVKKRIAGSVPLRPLGRSLSAVSSARKTVFFEQDKPLLIIGERINPTGKKALQEELKKGEFGEVRRLAKEQEEQGAGILDVNVGVAGADEKKLMLDTASFLIRTTDLPLCFDSPDAGVLEAVLRIYPGRALINSVSLEKKKITRLLPVAARYGAMFILLPVDDKRIPRAASERIGIVKQVFRKAAKYGYTKRDIIVDALVMAVSADAGAAAETLKVIEWCSRSFRAGSVIGLSNISFGLPEREIVNSAFLALACGSGLTSAIANPGQKLFMSVKTSLDLLLLKDREAKNYLSRFAAMPRPAEAARPEEALKPGGLIFRSVVQGDRESVERHVRKGLEEGIPAGEIVNSHLIPAIQKVGELFDRKEYFLPQLIQSAETMKKAFDLLLPLLSAGGASLNNKTIILATVRGDVHDIGKNIVGLMLKNYGFNVIDLGKNVEAPVIVAEALRKNPEIIGLSALMTTTMTEMKKVILLAREKGVRARFLVGGAVITDQYAKEIGAEYARDAVEAVRLAEKV